MKEFTTFLFFFPSVLGSHLAELVPNSLSVLRAVPGIKSGSACARQTPYLLDFLRPPISAPFYELSELADGWGVAQ